MKWRELIWPKFDTGRSKLELLHYALEQSDRRSRIHLRTEADGGGLIIVDATVVIRVNRTGMEIARALLEKEPLERLQRRFRAEYRDAAPQKVAEDYEKMRGIIFPPEGLVDRCPWAEIATSDEPFSAKVSAPYRADLALTYRCQNECPHCYVERDKQMPSLSVAEWKTVLGKLWEAGIPHICFTGGEATLFDGLPELIERAEDIGQIAGLLTNGRRLSDRAYARSLVAAGLDHVQITLESHEADIHNGMVGAEGFEETLQGLKNMIEDDVYVVTNTTLTTLNAPKIEETIEFLHQLGVKAFACNSLIMSGGGKSSEHGLSLEALEQTLRLVKNKADELGMRFIWYTPTPYCKLNPAQLGLGLKRCTAAEYNICIEPDGGVIPCQSCYQTAGNILRDNWRNIWNGDIFRAIRERLDVPPECRACPDFSACGSGCPLDRAHEGKVFCTDRVSEG